MTDKNIEFHCRHLFPAHRLHEMPDSYSLIPQGYENAHILFFKEESGWNFELSASEGDFFYSSQGGWSTSDGKPASLTSLTATKIEMLAELLVAPTSQPPADGAEVSVK